jgi:hypothetical protein
MEQIVIQVSNKAKAQLLSELLRSLDFVETVAIGVVGEKPKATAEPEAQDDFFSFAGLWEGRDISLELIRQQAWPRQKQ